MRHASVAGWTSALSASVSAVVLFLMLYRGVAEPEPGDLISLDALGWAIFICAFSGLVISVVLLAYSRFLWYSAEYALERARRTQIDEQVPESPVEDVPVPLDISGLPDDERRLYGLVEAAGGEILQMKLVSSGEFSKSKVTRLLDKLEDRELIKRERHGMTNMVRLTK